MGGYPGCDYVGDHSQMAGPAAVSTSSTVAMTRVRPAATLVPHAAQAPCLQRRQ